MVGWMKWWIALGTVLALTVGCSSEGGNAGEERVQIPGTNDSGNFGPQGMQPMIPGTAGMGGLPPVDSGDTQQPPQTPTANVGGLPCDVSAVLQNNCAQCHGETPAGGAIKLTAHEDWHRMSPLFDPTKKVFEVAQIRINDGSMPQGGVMSAGDIATLDAWLAAGALAAGPDEATCNTPVIPDDNDDDVVVEPPVTEGGTIDNCKKPGAFDPLVAEGDETCYEFDVHAPGGSGAFNVPTNETYHEWYYAVPWPAGSVWTRYGADFDNLQVLHHYLIFTSSAARAPGDVAQNVLGTTLGTSATLIGGWAVGGCRTELPEDVGGEIPQSPLIMVQWHMYNTTGRVAQDNSKVQVCTVPGNARPNTAGITFLGTENFNGPGGMPPGENDFTTRCANNSGAPITIIGFNPHMHLLGTNMKTDIISGGTATNIFDMPFQFDYQVSYDIPPATVMPGDIVETTCSFFNDTGSNVAFGESTNTEMCYQFALSYPAGALNNGALSLIGALNTCW